MLNTGFFDKVSGILTGQILLTGLLPAFLTFGYCVLIVTRLSDWSLAELWSGQISMATVLAALCIIAFALLFEGLNPLLKRWLSGGAVWFPEALRLRREREVHRLESDVLRIAGRSRAWRTKQAELQALLEQARAAYIPSAAPLTNDAIEAARAVWDAALADPPTLTESAEQEIRALVARLHANYAAALVPRDELDNIYQQIQARMNVVSTALSRELGELQRMRATQFPTRDRIRPTRFGNVMAAIDSYAYDRYGIDGQLLWPRMRQVAKPADDWRAVENAQARVDFAVAAVWIHLALVVLALVTLRILWEWDLALLVGLLVGGGLGAIAFYQMALQSLTASGLQIQAALDLNRWALLDSLRLPRPANGQAEYELWTRVATFLLFSTESDDRRAIWYR
jgi:hypothetical protein